MLKKYLVVCKSRIDGRFQRRVMISAPSKKWIRDNWIALTGTNEFRIVDIFAT